MAAIEPTAWTQAAHSELDISPMKHSWFIGTFGRWGVSEA